MKAKKIKPNYRQFTSSELKWIEQFSKVMAKAPNTLFMFVGTGYGINILPLDEQNNRYLTKQGNMDGEAPLIKIETNLDTDGGDW